MASDQQILDLVSGLGEQAATALNQLIRDEVGVLVNVAVLIEPVGAEDTPEAIMLAASIDATNAPGSFEGTVRRVLEKAYQQAISRPPDIASPIVG